MMAVRKPIFIALGITMYHAYVFARIKLVCTDARTVPTHLRNAPANLLILQAMSATAGAERTECKLKHYFDKHREEAQPILYH